MMSAPSRSKALNSYQREAILSASPARLVTLLYDRLMLDLVRAETAQTAADWTTASQNLVHAQDIINELSSSLSPDVWDGAEQLLGIYNYTSTTLINANIRRDPGLTRECIAVLEPLRLAWHEAAVLPVGSVGSDAGNNS